MFYGCFGVVLPGLRVLHCPFVWRGGRLCWLEDSLRRLQFLFQDECTQRRYSRGDLSPQRAWADSLRYNQAVTRSKFLRWWDAAESVSAPPVPSVLVNQCPFNVFQTCFCLFLARLQFVSELRLPAARQNQML